MTAGYTVTADGRATDVALLVSVPGLDDAVLEALARCRFHPATRYGKATTVREIRSFRFQLPPGSARPGGPPRQPGWSPKACTWLHGHPGCAANEVCVDAFAQHFRDDAFPGPQGCYQRCGKQVRCQPGFACRIVQLAKGLSAPTAAAGICVPPGVGSR